MEKIEKICILIIDDDEDDFLITKDLLEEDSYTEFDVSWEPNANNGLQAIIDETFDVYLIDLHLGAITGLELIERGIEAGCKKPLILLTGAGDREIVLKAMHLGASDFLVKGQFNEDLIQRAILYAIRQRRTLHELSVSEARYRAVIESQNELICRYQLDGTLTFVNLAFANFVGLSREELEGKQLSQLVTLPHSDDVQKRVLLIKQNQQPLQYEVQIAGEGKEACWQQWTELPILDEQGRIVEVQAVGRDVTSQKMSELALIQTVEKERELGELKSRFVTMASHEFRTPLTTILSTASFLEMAEGQISAEKRGARLGKIRQAALNMTDLLDDVLIFGKADAGKLAFSPSSMFVDVFFKELLEDIAAGNARGHKITLTNTSEKNEVFFDEKLFRQICTNLITNAIKYSPDNSEIVVSWKQQGDMFHLSVTDQGFGIPEKDQPHIFTPFHRAKNVKNISGTGLGLANTKIAVELHDGSISFESKPELGTTFNVLLPIDVG